MAGSTRPSRAAFPDSEPDGDSAAAAVLRSNPAGIVGTAPAIDLNGADPGIDNDGAYTENAGAGALAAGLTVTDADSANIASAAVQVTGGFQAGLDQLTVNGAASGTLSGISFSYDAGTGILSLSGSATLAAYEGVLRQVGFSSASNDPGPSRTIMWTVNDGTSGSTPAFTSITVTEVNDSPAGADKTITLTEDSGAYVFTVADFGFSDVDGDNFAGFLVNGTPVPGTLLLDPDAEGPQAPAPVTSGQFIIAFHVQNGQLTYVPAANGEGSPYASFSFQIFDDGGTANGGVSFDQSSNSITFNVTGVNDAPALDLNGAAGGTSASLNYTENDPVTAIAAAATVTDVDTLNFNGGHLLVQMTNGLSAEDVLSVIHQGNGAGQIGFVGGVVTYQGAPIADLVPSASPFPVLDIAFRSGTIVPAAVQALVRAIGYSNLSDAPSASPARSVSFTLTDGDGTANGGADSAIATATVNVAAVEDSATARPDAVATDEATILAGNVLTNNGSGADSDPDGPPPGVIAVNGSAIALGNQITLASGALLTLNANGSFSYNPNHAFDATPAPGSGASNAPAHDSFAYTLAGGSTTTVSVSIVGLDNQDLLLGTAGADVLLGGVGNDTLQGLGGNDYLDGGGGTDSLTGGSGNDSLVVDEVTDTVIEASGGGIDTVFARGSFTLGAGQEVEYLSAVSQSDTAQILLVGNEFSQFLYGNAGANYLDGGSGNDTLVGFGGDDSYVVDDVNDYVAEVAGGGSDIVYVRGSFSLGSDQEVETLAALSQAGTAPIVIVGNNFNQIIYGNAGANYLDGGSGNDTLVGFGGDDSYVVDDVNDYVAEVAGGGSDIVYVRGSFSLGSDQEVETLAALSQAGTAPIVIVGNNFNQIIYGNAGANYLDGGSGNDTLVGFGGNDTYVVDSLSDYVAEAAGQGSDVVYARSSYTLVAGQEIETLSAISQGATTALDLTGNALANALYGNAGANVLNGGAGADYLQGFGGADTFAFTTALGGGNVDHVADFLGVDDTIALDDAVFSGLSPGALPAGAFVLGAAAGDADDRILYDGATGNLYYDADGNGAGAAILFAILDGHPALTAGDFTVI